VARGVSVFSQPEPRFLTAQKGDFAFVLSACKTASCHNTFVLRSTETVSAKEGLVSVYEEAFSPASIHQAVRWRSSS
jgi:hypothetical protein